MRNDKNHNTFLSPLASAILAKTDPTFQSKRGTGKITVNLERLERHPEIQIGQTPIATRTEAALTIVRVLSDPPQFVVIKDREKSRFGFPFGGRELGQNENGVFDKDPYETSVRETLEEIFFGVKLDFDIEVTEKNFVGKIIVRGNRGNHDHVVYIFWTDVPASAPIRAGEEQESAFAVPWETILWYIEEGIFLPKHSNACIKFQRFCEKQGFTPLTFPPLATDGGETDEGKTTA